jgi:hypothetical protein
MGGYNLALFREHQRLQHNKEPVRIARGGPRKLLAMEFLVRGAR